jgi:hypothetical protein
MQKIIAQRKAATASKNPFLYLRKTIKKNQSVFTGGK